MAITRINDPLIAYPVGSIYMSVNSTSPATLFGGTWERITGKFLLAATDNGSTGTNVQSTASAAPGASGGAATHTLTPAQTATKNHSHTMAHTHVMSHGHGHTNPTVSYKTAKEYQSGTNKYGLNSGGTGTANMTVSGGGVTNFTGSTQGSSAANTGGQTEANGAAHNNMPPFLSVYIWKRTA